jgi:cell division protein FtsZ
MDAMKITIAGLGGCGCQLVDCLADEIWPGVETVLINTDARSLAACRAESKLQIGKGRTEGLGTGGDATLGLKAAEDDMELVRAILADTQVLFMVVGLGGGTGSGAAPRILEEARECGVMTICLATLPFRFEGPQRRAQADRTLSRMRELCNAMIVVPNDEILETAGDVEVKAVFATADRIMRGAVAGLCRLMTRPGPLNLDLADLRRVIQGGIGQCTLGYGEGRGPDKAAAALVELLGGGMMEKGQVLERSGAVLVSIVGDADLRMKDVQSILDGISTRVAGRCYVISGTILEESWSDCVAVTLVAAEGIGAKVAAEPKSAEVAETEEIKAISSRGKKRAAAASQSRLRLDSPSRGRFKDVEPTMLDGEDMDVPTYKRRNITIER